MSELAWSLGVFASFVSGFGAGAFLVALGNAAGRETPSPEKALTPDEAELVSRMANMESHTHRPHHQHKTYEVAWVAEHTETAGGALSPKEKTA